MRIAIDARALTWTGIGRYIRNLLIGLARLDRRHEYTALVGAPDRAAFATLKQEHLDERFTAQVVEPSYYSWREQIVLPWQLASVEADLFHFTHFNRPLLFHRPAVVTIHDTTRFIFPGEQRQGLLQQLAYEVVFARAVGSARGIICVSETTRQELTGLPLQLPSRPIVIPEGIEARFFANAAPLASQKVRMLIGTTDPYLLFVGVWMSHKNLSRLLAAFADVLPTHPQLKLVLTGKPKPGYDNILERVRKLGIEASVIFAGFVPEELLPALYAEAACFVFPSLYEGFGLPPLEAAACGTPVITSNVSSLPEVMLDAAYYVNPEYIPGITAAIREVLENQDLRTRLITAGRKRADQCTWEKAAQEHVALYETALNGEVHLL